MRSFVSSVRNATDTRLRLTRSRADGMPPFKALRWLAKNELSTGGIRVESGHPNAYPEVSGYLIPTLVHYGNYELAASLTRWLICIQRADGSFPDPDTGAPYVFDTGQVLRGLLASSKEGIVPEARASARQAADYVLNQMLDGGADGFAACYQNSNCPEAVRLYVLPPLIEASLVLQDDKYRDAARRCLDYYIRQPNFLSVDELSHFLAYQLEALIDLGRIDLARPVLDQLRKEQQSDGAVRAIAGTRWVCAPGLAQLAICWYKVGDWRPADQALNWLEAHQERSGGFRGSYGVGAAYKPSCEVSWAAKFYLDAHLLRAQAFFGRYAQECPDTISPNDGRAQAVLRCVRSGDKVLEVGCGKGRFISLIKKKVPTTECAGVDPSSVLLGYLESDIDTRVGSLEDIPHPRDSFDVVFAVEAVEHSIDQKRALQEMVRVVKPGGWVIVIDKQQAHVGRLKCPPWESWLEIEQCQSLLRQDCDAVAAERVAYDHQPASDGLMVAWSGRKRSRLTGSEWNGVLMAPELESDVVSAVRFNRLSKWAESVLLRTRVGERVLEIGSGTAQISLQLAQAGRVVTCLDSSDDSLRFARRCSRTLGVEVGTVCADATQRLPFGDRQFDCVWSSGLLEHFVGEQRCDMLQEWARVCRGRMIHLVPNAACLAYRFGKRDQESGGVWPYGLEMPLVSLRDDYAAAGIQVVEEFTVAVRDALNFLGPELKRLRQALEQAFGETAEQDGTKWSQGYLLVTVGNVASSK